MPQLTAPWIVNGVRNHRLRARKLLERECDGDHVIDGIDIAAYGTPLDAIDPSLDFIEAPHVHSGLSGVNGGSSVKEVRYLPTYEPA